MTKPVRILICTEAGHFKQWILYSDGRAEYGAIGKKQTPKQYSLSEGHMKADDKLNARRPTGQYAEYTKQEYDQFIKGYKILCAYGPLAVSKLTQQGIEEELEVATKQGRRILI
jgi:hypothetical protein